MSELAAIVIERLSEVEDAMIAMKKTLLVLQPGIVLDPENGIKGVMTVRWIKPADFEIKMAATEDAKKQQVLAKIIPARMSETEIIVKGDMTTTVITIPVGIRNGIKFFFRMRIHVLRVIYL